jgi:hypothetical protein
MEMKIRFIVGGLFSGLADKTVLFEKEVYGSVIDFRKLEN